jgi:2-dehydropantoate 2-reductase
VGKAPPGWKQSALVFQSAGIPVVACANMDAWLKTHAALILPIAGALYLAGGDMLHLADDRAALAWMVRRYMTIVYCQCPILG